VWCLTQEIYHSLSRWLYITGTPWSDGIIIEIEDEDTRQRRRRGESGTSPLQVSVSDPRETPTRGWGGSLQALLTEKK
jgi:hypothetical protein